jgi:hypothetical protein
MAGDTSARSTDPSTLGSSEEESTYLGGFPSGYTIVIDGFGEATLDELRELGRGGYVDTDVWEPSSGNPDSIAQLQTLLVNAGLLDPTEISRPGYYEPSTKAAYRELLAQANAWGTSWDDALSRLSANPNARMNATGGGQRYRGTNPLEFGAAAESASTSVLGRGLTDEERSRVAQKLVAQEAQFLGADSTVQPPGENATKEALHNQVRALDPIRADSRSAVKVAAVLEKLLTGEEI